MGKDKTGARGNGFHELVNEITLLHLGFSLESLKPQDRHREISEARHIAHHLLRSCGYSLNESGRFTARDHSTVLHSEKFVSKIRQVDAKFDKLVATMEDDLKTKINEKRQGNIGKNISPDRIKFTHQDI